MSESVRGRVLICRESRRLPTVLSGVRKINILVLKASSARGKRPSSVRGQGWGGGGRREGGGGGTNGRGSRDKQKGQIVKRVYF